MKTTTLSLAALALAAAVIAMPLSAEAAHKRSAVKTWDCEMFGWLDASLCKQKAVKKHVKKHGKKKYATKSSKRMKKS